MSSLSEAGRPAASLLRIWRAEATRRVVLQAAVLLCLVAVLAIAGINAVQNLTERGIASGFGFLSDPAGYGVAFSLIPYDLTDTHGRVFLVGLLNTLLVSVTGIVLSSVLGLIIGVLRLSGNWLVGVLATAYVEVIRNVPLLLQILFWYAVVLLLPTVRESLSVGGLVFLNNRAMELPAPVFGPGMGWVGAALLAGIAARLLLGRIVRRRGSRSALRPWTLGLILGAPLIVFLALGAPLAWDVPEKGRFNFSGGMSVPATFVALLIALTTYTAAFIGEIVRAGIQSVAKGQSEAAAALGLRPGPTMRLIILPQALRVIIPPTTSQYLNLTKNSSLGIVIGYPDIVATFGAATLNQTGQAIETLAMIMAFYLTVSLTISLLMNWYNRSIQLEGARR